MSGDFCPNRCGIRKEDRDDGWQRCPSCHAFMRVQTLDYTPPERPAPDATPRKVRLRRGER